MGRVNRDQLRIIHQVADWYGYEIEDLRGRSRLASLVHARQVAAYLLVEAGYSRVETGHALGGRDHTTIINAIRRIGKLVTFDVGIRNQVDAVRRHIQAEPTPREMRSCSQAARWCA